MKKKFFLLVFIIVIFISNVKVNAIENESKDSITKITSYKTREVYNTIDDLPFELLDQGEDMTVYERLEQNEPVLLQKDEIDRREYYGYFGYIKGKRRKDDESIDISWLADDYRKTLPAGDTLLSDMVTKAKKGLKPSLLGPSIVTNSFDPKLPAESNRWATYAYDYGSYMGYNMSDATHTVGDTPGSGIQFATVNRDGNTYTGIDQEPAVLKLLKGKNSVVGYGALWKDKDESDIIGLVRIKIFFDGDRIQTQVRHLKLTDGSQKLAMGYALFTSIRSRSSLLSNVYSLGNDAGVYFKSPPNDPKWHIDDGKEYLLYFYKDGYTNQPDGQFITEQFNGSFFKSKNELYRFAKVTTSTVAKGTADPGENIMFPVNNDFRYKVIGYRWPAKLQEQYDINEYTLQQKISVRELPVDGSSMALEVYNLSGSDYKVKDKIEINGTFSDMNNDYENWESTIKLPVGLSIPNYASYTASNGIEYELDIKADYNEETRTLTVKGSTGALVPKTIHIESSITKEAAGKELEVFGMFTGNYLGGGKNYLNSLARIEVGSYVESAPVTIKYLDTNSKELKDSFIDTGNVNDPFEYKPADIPKYDHIETKGEAIGFYSTEPQEIIFIYKKKVPFTIKQIVSRNNGTIADEVNLGEELNYKVILKSEQLESTPSNYYRNLKIESSLLSNNLENIKNIILSTSDGGESIGEVSYNEETKKIIATLSEEDQIPATKSLFLTYKVSVKPDIPIGSKILMSSEAKSEYTNGDLSELIHSNENELTVIAGPLFIDRFPTKLSFGDLTISADTKNYSVQSLTNNLVIKDLRGKGSRWRLTAKLLTDLSDPVKNKTLTNVIYYKMKDQNPQALNTIESTLIYEDVSLSSNPINISSDWLSNDVESGIYLKLKGGQAKVGTYSADIQWSLDNVPSNEIE